MISIDWTLYVQIINFLLLVYLLNMVLFRPIRNAIRDRQAKLLAQEADINLLTDEGLTLEDEIKVDAEWATVEKKIKSDMAKARKSLQTQAQTFAQLLATKILGRELS
jgi:F-type H+-transporting ATPase subunit b